MVKSAQATSILNLFQSKNANNPNYSKDQKINRHVKLTLTLFRSHKSDLVSCIFVDRNDKGVHLLPNRTTPIIAMHSRATSIPTETNNSYSQVLFEGSNQHSILSASLPAQFADVHGTQISPTVLVVGTA